MVERVAEAINARLGEEVAVRPGVTKAIARLAIEAMRNPPESFQTTMAVVADVSLSMWQDVIDEALK